MFRRCVYDASHATEITLVVVVVVVVVVKVKVHTLDIVPLHSESHKR